jgi:HK97 family phage major capsid protein
MSTKGTISENEGRIITNVNDIFKRVHALLDKPGFSHEDNARCEQLLKLAELELPQGRAAFRSLDLAVLEQKAGLDQETYRRAFASQIRFGYNAISPEERATLQPQYKRIDSTPGELRALGFSTGQAGGYLVPEEMSEQIFEIEKLTSPVRAVAQTRTTSHGRDIKWPTVDDTNNVGELLAESGETTELDVPFSQTVLKSFRYSSKLIRVSLEWLQDSGRDVEAVLARLLGARIARAQNPHFTTGTGSGQPQGVVTASAQGKVGASATAVTFDELQDLIASVDPEYRAAARFMFRDETLTTISKLKEATTNAPLLNLDRQRLLGYPYQVNQSMAVMASNAKSILFGDFSQFLVRDAELILLRLGERFAPQAQAAFVVFQRSDSRMLNSAAIKHFANGA